MAAPNLISLATVSGKTRADWCLTSLTSILSNAVNSGEVYRINGLFVSNVGSSDVTVSLDFFRNGLGFFVCQNSPVPVGSTTVIMGKDNGLYIEEGDALRIRASATNSLQYIITYDILS
jgi:hypothetical protein